MSDTTHRIYINRAHVFNEGVTWTTIAGLYPHAYVPEDAFTALQAENDKLTAAIKRQSGAAKTLRASIMAEVQHLKDIDRSEYFAAKSLDSEREANSILTAERDAWKARAEELEAKLAKALSIACELSGCVEYDYHGNVMGHGTRKAMAELDKLL